MKKRDELKIFVGNEDARVSQVVREDKHDKLQVFDGKHEDRLLALHADTSSLDCLPKRISDMRKLPIDEIAWSVIVVLGANFSRSVYVHISI